MYFYLEQVKESHYLPRIFTWWYLPIQYRPCNLCCDLSVRQCQLQVKMFQFSLSVMPDCHPMDCNTPGLPVHHQLPELSQTHVHQVSDAIQPSYPLSSPSPSAFNLSQHQGLFPWVSSSHQVAKVLEVSASASVLPVNTQDLLPLGWTGLISLQSKGLYISNLLRSLSYQACCKLVGC